MFGQRDCLRCGVNDPSIISFIVDQVQSSCQIFLAETGS